jgi:ABC-type bacteriocin/lantibiotic exporter with double-glycine peptidase domain
MLNMLVKLISPQQGEILIDGQDLNGFSQDWVQKNIAYVT